MHSVILVALLPTTDEIRNDNKGLGLSERRSDFLGDAKEIAKRYGDTYRLGEGVWQIPLDTGAPYLAELVFAVQDNGLPYKILYLKRESDWHIYRPKNNQRQDVYEHQPALDGAAASH